MNQGKQIFEVLIQENADMLLAYLRASVRDKHAVDDIFQETMVVAWRRMPEFDRTRSFGKWLRGIARNLILAHFRKSSSGPLSMDENTLDWMDQKFAKIQSRSGDTLSEKLSMLRECVDALSEENKKTIEARYLEQYSLEEIVKRLGLALQTVKKRLYRAKSKLAECLEAKLLDLEEIS
ncbi:MAG: sigma-70 family RNA polymerase sigma factor [Planctomycetota bacterium]